MATVNLTARPGARAGYHVRFTPWQRALHGIVIATFLGLALTGMDLRFSAAVWAGPLARAVGGFAAILVLHKTCAVVLTIAFLIHVAIIGYRGLVQRDFRVFWGPDSLVPQLKDLRDIVAQFRWFLGRGPKPRFERFAYWEKFDYWAVFWGMAIIGISGYALWFGPWVARVLPGYWLNAALILHGEEALLAVWFIFSIHFFNTHLRPGNFPMDLVMFTGRETAAELAEKRAEQYARLTAAGALDLGGQPPSRIWERWATLFGWLIILAGFVMLIVTLVTFFAGAGG